ncbi:hypothetical protein VN12_17075 [Pirellula sp. SH-Sr6A]|nr:hypothetical protein VN12_17075 [Pirellula sp. SH-Sr6A]
MKVLAVLGPPSPWFQLDRRSCVEMLANGDWSGQFLAKALRRKEKNRTQEKATIQQTRRKARALNNDSASSPRPPRLNHQIGFMRRHPTFGLREWRVALVPVGTA